MQKGNIGVTTENIFPVIKKFLYSDHEIFLRELVSNAVDATQKLKTLASIGEFKGEVGDLTVHVKKSTNISTKLLFQVPTISWRSIRMMLMQLSVTSVWAFIQLSWWLRKWK